MQLSGIFLLTNDIAPILTLFPIVISPPRITEFAPIDTLSPIIILIGLLPSPIVTFCKIKQLSPISVLLFIVIAYKWPIFKFFPILVPSSISIENFLINFFGFFWQFLFVYDCQIGTFHLLNATKKDIPFEDIAIL